MYAGASLTAPPHDTNIREGSDVLAFRQPPQHETDQTKLNESCLSPVCPSHRDPGSSQSPRTHASVVAITPANKDENTLLPSRIENVPGPLVWGHRAGVGWIDPGGVRSHLAVPNTN